MIHSKMKLLACCLLIATATTLHADTVIIGGATGNGDFNAGGGGTSGGAQTYEETANWFNAQGAENINFTNSSQMGGSDDHDGSSGQQHTCTL